MKRDLANVALGNKDNHTRNTAIQRFNNGIIGLTPLFDFAPMWLHPDGIARTTRWERDDHGGMPIWHSVIEQIAESTMIDPKEIKAVLIEQLPLYQGLLEHMQYLCNWHLKFWKIASIELIIFANNWRSSNYG